MIYNKLGDSELDISAITFGAWAIGGWMWGGANKEDAIKAIHQAIDLGINTFDTAPVYGFGQSEEITGLALEGKRSDIILLTKFGLRWNEKMGQFYFSSSDNSGNPVDIYRYSGKESIIKECEDSLRRLKTDYIDLYQIHWEDPTTPVEETFEAVLQLIQQGKVRYAGVCNYSIELVNRASSIVPVVSNQVPYSMVYRDIESDVIPYSLENSMGILAYSPLQRGILTGKIRPGHVFGEGDHRPTTKFYKEPNLTRINQFLENIRPIAQSRNVSLAQLVINWTVSQPGITSALVGARDPEQVKENARALSFTLTPAELSLIREELDKIVLE
jgi:aryl-alcohol dehydrogenase-like predicted oxidoreductase